MGILYYNFSYLDETISGVLKNEEITFEKRSVLSRKINNADGSVTIPLTDLGTIKALHVLAEGPVTATINGQAVAIEDFLFVSLSSLTSLVIACSDVDGKKVDVAVWGT